MALYMGFSLLFLFLVIAASAFPPFLLHASPALARINRLQGCWRMPSHFLPVNGDDKQRPRTGSSNSFEDSICRVVASSDGKLPNSRKVLPLKLMQPPFMLDKLDLIYHALSHEETRNLKYLESEGREPYDEREERLKVISVLRSSLEAGGYQRLTQRDLDLCEALNAGYLLRLSILPDVSELDPSLATDFYPEIKDNGTLSKDELLFGGRVLVFRRGYSSETTKGRLLLPKLDYLQASLVQQSAFKVTQRLGKLERAIFQLTARLTRRFRMQVKGALEHAASSLPTEVMGKFFRDIMGWRRDSYSELKEDIRKSKERENVVFKLARYGGSKIRFVGSPNVNDALIPFLICQVKSKESDQGDLRVLGEVNHDIYERLNNGEFTCQYDAEHPDRHHKGLLPSTLLERVSIGNVVDVFSRPGRRRMLKNFLAPVELVEPTYEEVIVLWQPIPKKTIRQVRLPKAIYDAAEIFDMDDRLPEKHDTPVGQPPMLEVRAFDGVPMSNLLGVFPKTKLVFRPADALLFDTVSIFTFLLILGSRRYNSPQLDLLALISVGLWIFRTVIRYSNKLARYDLLVKNFLTSKIAHRDGGAVKYVANEAASQKAIRASLLHTWLASNPSRNRKRTDIVTEAFLGVNELLQCDQYVDVDVDAGLIDLETLGLISFSSDGQQLLGVVNEETALEILKSTWSDVFEGKLVSTEQRSNNAVYDEI